MSETAMLEQLRDEVRSIACWISPTGACGFDVDGDERKIILDLIDQAITGTLGQRDPARPRPIREPRKRLS